MLVSSPAMIVESLVFNSADVPKSKFVLLSPLPLFSALILSPREDLKLDWVKEPSFTSAIARSLRSLSDSLKSVGRSYEMQDINKLINKSSCPQGFLEHGWGYVNTAKKSLYKMRSYKIFLHPTLIQQDSSLQTTRRDLRVSNSRYLTTKLVFQKL